MKNITIILATILLCLSSIIIFPKIAEATPRDGYYGVTLSPYYAEAPEDRVSIRNYILSVNNGLSFDTANSYAWWIVRYANANNWDPIFVAGAIRAESGFNAKCGGAQSGLFQMNDGVFNNAKACLDMPSNASIWDAQYNIQAGVFYLESQRIKIVCERGKTGRTDREALLAYNCGYGGASSRGWSDNFHVRKVITNKQAILRTRDY